MPFPDGSCVCGASAGHPAPACQTSGSCWLAVQVTKKKAAGEEETENRWDALKEALWYTWPHLAYYVAYIAGLTFFVVKCCLGRYRWVVGLSGGA